MTEVDDGAIVLRRSAPGGRFLIFTSTDVLPGWLLPWWCVVLDTGGDVAGVLVRLDEAAAPSGRTARQLLTLCLARAKAQAFLDKSVAAAEVWVHVANAVRTAGPPQGGEPLGRVTFVADPSGSPYGGTVARHEEFSLSLCPDPGGVEEGITPEQLLILLDQLLGDALRARSREEWVQATQRRIAAALSAEVRRAAVARAHPPRSV